MEEQTAIELSTSVYGIVSFSIYIVFILAIGAWSSKFSSLGINEFFLGGRRMNKFVVALSAVVSGRSGWLLLGLTGMAYSSGMSAIWAAVGYIVTEYLMFIYAAPKLREQTEQNEDITISDFFSSRFQDKRQILRLVSAIIIIIFMTAYISAQFVGGGKTFSASFEMSEFTGVILTAVIVLIYTLLGGFLAVSLTDVIQAVIMIFALVVLPIIAVSDFGGFTKLISEINIADASILDPFALSAGALIGFVGIGLGSPGSPHILVRYMSIKSPKDLKFSAYVGTFWNIAMAVFAVSIGVIGRAYFESVELLPNGDPEYIFPYLAQLHLHPILFGVVVAAILAAIMSTADSMLLVCASALIRDVYQKTINPKKNFTEKELVYFSRLIIFSVVTIAWLFGLFAGDLVFWLVLFAWAGLGAAFGPPLILSLFWKKTTKEGVLAGFISGMLVIFIWNQTEALKNLIYELVPGFFVSFVLTVIFSLIFYKKREEISKI